VQVALLIKCFNLNLGRDMFIMCSNIKFLFDLFCVVFENIYNKILLYLQLSPHFSLSVCLYDDAANISDFVTSSGRMTGE
jgi:uncharacterized protein with ParB-like and HNH nuclease domain